MNAIWMPLLASALVFGSVLMVGLAVVQRAHEMDMRRSLALVLRIGGVRPADEELTEINSGSVLGDMIAWLGDHLTGESGRKRLRRLLPAAGLAGPSDLRDAMNRKAIYTLAGFLVGVLFWLLMGGAWWLLVILGPVAGLFLPDLLIYNAGLKRTQEIQSTLPDALDLLDLCVESGLGMQAALSRVSRHQKGPVAEEFGRVLQEMKLGVSRDDAFEALAERTGQEDLRRFVTAIVQADKLGVPVAAVLKEQAREMRAKRRSRAREMAQKVPVKIVMPLIVCLLPGLFIVVMGPAAISIMGIFSR